MELVNLFMLCAQILTISAYPSLQPEPNSSVLKIPLAADTGFKPSSLATGIFPPWPRGLGLVVKFPAAESRGLSLNPLHVYTLAIEALVARLQFTWSEPAAQWGYRSPRVPMMIHVGKHDMSLANMHVALGIYSAVLDMATRGFPLTKYSLILSSRWIGSVWVIGPARSESASNNTTTELVGENDTQAIRLADSGRIIDANDPTVAINFHYTGRSISSKDYFEVLMQAAVILAYDGPSRPFQILHAINHAGTVVLNINAFHGQGEHPAKKIGTSLLLVLQARLAGRSFDGLEFTVMIGHPDHRQAVAQGSIFRLTPHQPPGGEVATAK